MNDDVGEWHALEEERAKFEKDASLVVPAQKGRAAAKRRGGSKSEPIIQRVGHRQMENGSAGRRRSPQAAMLKVEVDEAELVGEASLEHRPTLLFSCTPEGCHRLPEFGLESALMTVEGVLLNDDVVSLKATEGPDQRRRSRTWGAEHGHNVGRPRHFLRTGSHGGR